MFGFLIGRRRFVVRNYKSEAKVFLLSKANAGWRLGRQVEDLDEASKSTAGAVADRGGPKRALKQVNGALSKARRGGFCKSDRRGL